MKRRAWILVTVVALVAVVRIARHRPADPCPLVQTWTAGDVHLYEILTLSPDQRGRWELGSFDHEVEPDTQAFSWEASGPTLVVTADGARREVRFSIEPSGSRCRLTFDAPPLPRSYKRAWYTGGL